MKKIYFLFTIFYSFAFSQEMKDIDKLTIDVCNSILKSKENEDSIKIQNAFSENFISFAEKFKLSDLNEDLAKKIDYRLQKNCDWYQEFLSKKFGYNEKSDWKILDQKPKIKAKANECKNFFKKHSKFYYFESEGDKTLVDISNNFWIDKFTDNTYSKLSFKLENCHFELQFIESNNSGRSTFSSKDDVYYYDIIDIQDQVLTVITYQRNSSKYYQYKLYATD